MSSYEGYILNIVFFGTPGFAVPTLDALISSQHEVLAVVTQPDRRSGRGRRPAVSPVKKKAHKAKIRIVQPVRAGDADFLHLLNKLNPSVIVVVAYGQILPAEIIRLPVRGCINIHASLLPRYRGAAPINWSIIRGDTQTGVTTMLMDEGMDTGPVLIQAEIEIHSGDTAGSLSEKLSVLGAETLIQTLDMLERGALRPMPQTGNASYAPPLNKRDGLIRWQRPAVELFNFIRGVNPWPGAYTFLGRERIGVLKAFPLDGKGEAGTIQHVAKNELIVGTGEGRLSLLSVQRAGKMATDIQAFLQGTRMSQGMRFNEAPVD